ncbi:MAG: hypothetical protein J6Q73_04290 [Bacteroidaceae bacterium]|nr:hypothetical protein [Bacteroidaceae bacterium]
MQRRIHQSKIILLFFGLLVIAACRNNDCMPSEKSSTLIIELKSTENSIKTRGIEDLNDDGTVSDVETIVDGRKMYRLAVILLDGNKPVTSTVLEADDPRFTNDNTEAVISFNNLDYNKSYRLYAVANYGNHDALTGNLADVTEDNILSGLKVNASSDNVCDCSTPYPLSFSKEINLTPGANIINGELLRTYARLRINVRNQSSVNDLCITSLSLDTKFTQQTADLFNEGGVANVSPVVTSPRAITPFEKDHVIPKLSDSGNVSEATIFDTYLLESTGGNYNYTIGLKYEGGTEEVYTVNNTAIRNSNNIEDGAMYVIYNPNSQRYLYANGSTVNAGTSYLVNGNLNHNYVWKFKRTSSNNYTIESMGETGYYMQGSKITTGSLPLTVSPSSSDYFTASTSNNNIRLRATTKSNYYISINGSSVYGNSSTTSSQQRRYNLYLYKVEKSKVVSDVTCEEKIPIRVIDKNSGAALPITAIRRNDFIDILVNVSYNEKTGDVDFEVSDWNSVDGEVTFD